MSYSTRDIYSEKQWEDIKILLTIFLIYNIEKIISKQSIFVSDRTTKKVTGHLPYGFLFFSNL